MSNKVNLNNCSEDIFQSCYEPSEAKLRRSQRVLERRKTTTRMLRVGSENILDDDTIHVLKQSLPPNQTEAKNLSCEIKDERNDGDITPDFTYMFNTSVTEVNPNQLEATQKRRSISVAETLKDFPAENPLDLRLVSNKDSLSASYLNKHTQQTTTARKKQMDVATLKNVQKSTRKFRCSQVKENLLTTADGLENLATSASKSTEAQNISSVNTEIDQFIENRLGKKTTTNVFQNAGPTSTKKEEYIEEVKAKHQKLSTAQLNCSTNENKAEQINQSKKVIQKRRKTTIVKLQSNTDVSKRKRRGRPPKQSSNLKKEQEQKFMETKQTTMKNYVAPKVIRYFNTCPIIQKPYSSSADIAASSKSLLPAVYPSYFTQQKLISNDVPIPTHEALAFNKPIIPITCLTPENSQALSQLPVEVKCAGLSSPVSVGSLQEFFEKDELYEILNNEKTIYNLTELHVRALALTLNLNAENLFTVIDKIVELDANVLRDTCKLCETKAILKSET